MFRETKRVCKPKSKEKDNTKPVKQRNTYQTKTDKTKYKTRAKTTFNMDMEDLMHDLLIGNFWGMTELFLE
jgi:hypothetical protein